MSETDEPLEVTDLEGLVPELLGTAVVNTAEVAEALAAGRLPERVVIATPIVIADTVRLNAARAVSEG